MVMLPIRWRVVAFGVLLLLLALAWNLIMRRQNQALAAARGEAERLAVTDQLTGIFNRRYLDQILQHEVNRTERYADGFAVIMVDIDLFKQVNDTHGHLVGDEVLKGVAELLKARSRNSDIVGRWGGEEFIIVCPNITPENTLKMAEDLRHSIASADFGDVGHKTASFGVALYRRGDRPEDVVNAADEALYQAKENGRNRVVFADI